MGLESYITDSSNHNKAHVVTHNDKDSKNALVVATHPLKTYENELRFFTSPIYGIDMNIGRTIDLTENVYNGGDNTYWTGSYVVAVKWDLTSTDQAHTGTRSVKANNPNINSSIQFLKSSDITLTNYNELSIWIYVTSDWEAGDNISIYGWDSGTGTKVGINASLGNYFNFSLYGVWQKIIIPLSDMNLTGETIDALRVQVISRGGAKSPIFYLDDIQILGLAGEPGAGTFTVKPELGTWIHVSRISISLADDVTGIVADGTMTGLSYNKLLGLNALSSGILYQRVENNKIIQTLVIRQLSDYLQFPTATINSAISDGTNTFVNLNSQYTEPIILKSENKDRLQITINDNLSELLLLRATVGTKLERR